MVKQKKTTKIQKKHSPAILRYTVRSFNQYKKITDDDKTKAFVFANLIRGVNFCISNNKDVVELFDLIDHNSTICLKKDAWKDTLNTAIDFYVDKEMYENCAECKRLISLL